MAPAARPSRRRVAPHVARPRTVALLTEILQRDVAAGRIATRSEWLQRHRLDLSPANLSHILAGDRAIGHGLLGQFLRALDRADAARLLKAYLDDEVAAIEGEAAESRPQSLVRIGVA